MIKYIEVNGMKFAYLEKGTGPLVLCYHGFPDSAYSFESLLSTLANSGYRAIAPFLRGYSPTDIPVNKDYTAQALGEDIISLIDAFGEKEAILIGHDWGAVASYAAAELAPSRIKKLIILSIPHFRVIKFKPVWWLMCLLFQIPSVAEWVVRYNNYRFINKLYDHACHKKKPSEKDLAPIKNSLAADGGLSAIIGYYRALQFNFSFKNTLSVPEALNRKTKVPCLAITGNQDPAYDSSIFERTYEAFEESYKVIYLDGVGHFPLRECPEEVTDEILEFLKS